MGTSCPAAHSECRFCHKIGQWAMYRKKLRPISAQYSNPTGHQRTHDHKFDELKFNEIRTDSNNDLTADLYFTLRGQLATMTVKVDTGAEGNILPLRTYLRMYPEHCTGPRPTLGHLKRSLTTLTVYNGESMKHYGTIDLYITLNDYTTRTTFFVAETPSPIILGLPSKNQMKIITINQIKTEIIKTISDLTKLYLDSFEGIGNFEGTYHIVTDPTIPPVVHAPRRTPILIIREIKEELDQLERAGVIEKVTEPTDWVSSLVYARKQSGKPRICLDPRYLNKAIKRPHYPTKTIEGISYKLIGAKIFSKLDARQEYWAVNIDHESSLKTTFNSPHGKYRFNRLPSIFSQDMFQLKMDMIIENCPERSA